MVGRLQTLEKDENETVIFEFSTVKECVTGKVCKGDTMTILILTLLKMTNTYNT
jgi:hypothetical protein